MIETETVTRRVKEILSSHVDAPVNIERVDDDTLLDAIGVNSINFIRAVLEMEGEFDFEFDIDHLGYENFGSIRELVSYVRQHAAV